MGWTVYIIEASDGSLYTGITTNMERRWQEHAEGLRGAKFFCAGRRPERLRYQEPADDRSAATQREIAIKRMNRAQKLSLIGQHP